MEEIRINLIVLTDYESLVDRWADPTTRMRWGVLAQPILKGGYWTLPLGWEEELTKAGIQFEIKEVTYHEEMI